MLMKWNFCFCFFYSLWSYKILHMGVIQLVLIFIVLYVIILLSGFH